ncbi:Re/Si-specific NAD(P)(+) transhydrogenase subunit alpha [Oceanibacterium hippocampi]|uniref:NAD(P) transhydrogenase subunit alpha part 1 n=1 Tax=Oceanibacterium hippocampi TaxID=745714 RepID=A0A1Y5SAG1_9PROT|nr:Re/Si-specific NAD(P)(+) transhydrogenase subunit alpha [Oceanibacterium hippocampi]SLN35483.1 NAD(P) transhydrogenase subunit alpha part 1 [Oceanibacterium hippocampi]
MKLAVPRERRPDESRVAISPDMVKKLTGLGFDVIIEAGAGTGANMTDAAYEAAGATIVADEAAALGDADVVFKVQRPLSGDDDGPDEIAMMKKGAVLIGSLAPLQNREQVKAYAAAGIDTFAMEMVPRITRAQSMDVLSSQANLAGYKAVLDACAHYGRAMPMMMTAAGTIAPARVFVMGAGVAGLQAIATARRLGAIVSATDVRPEVAEQIQSLGAKYIGVESEESGAGAGGYAKEMSDDYKQRQAALIAETIKKQDIVITTAAIPGRAAPRLVSEEMLASMKPGSVIVDLAVETGGNCALSKPGEVVRTDNGVLIVGYRNVPGRLAEDASALYARNLVNFITPLVDSETKALKIDWEDEIVKGAGITRDGAVVHPMLQEEGK